MTQRSSAGGRSRRAGIPTDSSLRERLNAMWPSGGALEVLERNRNVYTSSAPTEIVTVRVRDHEPMTLFCKYFSANRSRAEARAPDPFNEVNVYRHIHRPPLTVPRLFGTHVDPGREEAWLVTEYLAAAVRLKHVAHPAVALELASRWIGEFHRLNEARVGEGSLHFLRHLNADHFHHRLKGILMVLDGNGSVPTWLVRLQAQLDGIVASLEEATTVVHAEYYPKNILVSDGRIFPVDWETASAGPGSIDLAMLLTAWRPTIRARCAAAYREASGTVATQREVLRRLAVADVLIALHWLALGVAHGRSVAPDGTPALLDRLRETAAAIGIRPAR